MKKHMSWKVKAKLLSVYLSTRSSQSASLPVCEHGYQYQDGSDEAKLTTGSDDQLSVVPKPSRQRIKELKVSNGYQFRSQIESSHSGKSGETTGSIFKFKGLLNEEEEQKDMSEKNGLSTHVPDNNNSNLLLNQNPSNPSTTSVNQETKYNETSNQTRLIQEVEMLKSEMLSLSATLRTLRSHMIYDETNQTNQPNYNNELQVTHNDKSYSKKDEKEKEEDKVNIVFANETTMNETGMNESENDVDIISNSNSMIMTQKVSASLSRGRSFPNRVTRPQIMKTTTVQSTTKHVSSPQRQQPQQTSSQTSARRTPSPRVSQSQPRASGGGTMASSSSARMSSSTARNTSPTRKRNTTNRLSLAASAGQYPSNSLKRGKQQSITQQQVEVSSMGRKIRKEKPRNSGSSRSGGSSNNSSRHSSRNSSNYDDDDQERNDGVGVNNYQEVRQDSYVPPPSVQSIDRKLLDLEKQLKTESSSKHHPSHYIEEEESY
eukprot:CAMPEP_0114404594 /NCGR_PEP_ID=MMETSP0102-20121206/19715_1 /TAXON_ID=38822 ORGANISM="Pteridomonas danica, Strain PT" /NCGR_SAMPLE_ID=MMETSP0102 /ASSEMBLY_ACC=CAM_ASM_000212 /LENGTH=488 /DNA_ID=CAMNT_0001569451 /DNA_START=15 /DNA_END=1482 /DNA_ORIENTATION=-